MATAIKMPQLGLTMTEGTISKWVKQEGEQVKEGEVIAEVETDKITGEVQAPTSGILRTVIAPVGATVEVTGLLGYVGDANEVVDTVSAPPAAPPAPVAARPASPAAPSGTDPGDGRIKITPMARKLAVEAGLDLATLTGSGPGGRIVEADVRRAMETSPSPPVAAAPVQPPAAAPAPSVPVPTPPSMSVAVAPAVEQRAIRERIPLTGMRRTIADRMQRSLQQSAQLTLGTEADATALVRARKELVADAKASGADAGPSYTDLLVKISARALREHPAVNATISGDEILLLEDVHVGVAVALETGLIVPVIRHADRMSLGDIGQQSRRLVTAARENKLSMGDVAGASFTITNLGMFDIDFFTPIINPPESAILGIGRLVSRVVPDGDATAVRQMMTLSLTFDHRVFDGAPAARFLQRIKRLVENPLLAL